MTECKTSTMDSPKRKMGRFLYTIYDIGRIYREIRAYEPPASVFFARKRLAAFAVDFCLLSLVCIAAMFLFYEKLAAIHVYGELCGMALFVLYHGLGNSRLFNGATLGKRLFGLKTTDRDSRLLSVPRSLWRSFVLSCALFPCYVFVSLYGFAIVVVRMVFMFATVYLLFFNRQTRQSLHDYMAGSYVYAKQAEDAFAKVDKPKLWKGHRWVTGLFCLLVVSFLSSLFFSLSLNTQRNAEQLAEVREMLAETKQDYIISRVHTIPIYAMHFFFPVSLKVGLIRTTPPKSISLGLLDALDIEAVYLKDSALSKRANKVHVTIRYGAYTGLVNHWTEWREDAFKHWRSGELLGMGLSCYSTSVLTRIKICRYIDKNGKEGDFYFGRGLRFYMWRVSVRLKEVTGL